ncbi:MAG: hypothetical protein FWC71_07980 [Defluviitaleaceae bacterium]|nr:hypothetical protein [Defluviitaleaceae bacterium]
MKKAFIAMAFLICFILITGCGLGNTNEAPADDAPDEILALPTEAPPETAPIEPSNGPEPDIEPDTTPNDTDGDTDTIDPADTTPDAPLPPDESADLLLAQLAATITAAGQFWEDWWAFEGIFSFTDGDGIFVPTDPDFPSTGMSFSPLLMTSGFSIMADIRNYLLQFYTPALVDTEMDGIFIKYEGLLHFANARAGFPRFDWTDATFAIMDQFGDNVIVEAIVRHGYFELDPGGYVALYFHMYQGRIQQIDGGSIVLATLDAWMMGGDEWDIFAAEMGYDLLFIATAFDSLLGSLTAVFEVDYNRLHGWEPEPWGGSLVIWATGPLFQLELISLTTDMLGEELIYIPTGSYGRIDVLQPGEGFVINNYIGMGTLPWSGITFLDEQGTRHHFFMQPDNSDSLNRYFIMFFVDRTHELPDDFDRWWLD